MLQVTQDQEEIAATIGNFQPSSWDMTQDDFEAELDSILAEDSPVKPAQPVSPSQPGYANHSADLSSLEDRLRGLYQPENSESADMLFFTFTPDQFGMKNLKLIKCDFFLSFQPLNFRVCQALIRALAVQRDGRNL